MDKTADGKQGGLLIWVDQMETDKTGGPAYLDLYIFLSSLSLSLSLSPCPLCGGGLTPSLSAPSGPSALRLCVTLLASVLLVCVPAQVSETYATTEMTMMMMTMTMMMMMMMMLPPRRGPAAAAAAAEHHGELAAAAADAWRARRRCCCR